MIKSLINAKTSDPLKLIPNAIDAATDFDNENNEGSQLAIEHTKAFACFLWSMSKGKVPQVETVLRPDDEALQKYMEYRKR